MRLHHLKMTAFGPFPDTVEIPFGDLEQGGAPFLLTGPTGSGKTSVLDAVCFAIYGKVPRGGKGPDVVSLHREEGTSPSVELELSIGDERLKVVRVPLHYRKKTVGEGTTKVSHQVVVSRWNGEGWDELSTSVEGAKKELETDRLRMNENQFGQVVMLPQGDFARFLQSKPEERKSLLRQLFPGEDLGQVQDWLESRAAQVRAERDECRQELEVEVNKAWVEVNEAAEERGDPVVESPSHLDQATFRDRLAEARVPLEKERNEALAVERRAAAARSAALEEKERLEKRAALVEERGLREDQLTGLLAKRDEVATLRADADAASRAAAVAPLAEAAKTRVGVCEQLLSERESLLGELSRDPEVGTIEPQELTARRDELRTELSRVRDFESEGLGDLRRLEGEARRLEALGRDLEDPDSDRNGPRVEARARVERADGELEAAKRSLLDIRHARNLGMAAELAESLEEGAPCVVCGSTDHPSPATLPEGAERFEKTDEEEAERRVGEAEKERDTAKEALASIELQLEKLKSETTKELETTRTGLATARESEQALLAGSPTIEARAERLEKVTESIDAALRTIERSEGARKEADRSLEELETEAKNRGFATSDEARKALVEPAELADMQKVISDYETDLESTRRRLGEEDLEGIERDEQVDTTGAIEVARKAEHDYTASVERSTTTSNRLSKFDERAAVVPKVLDRLDPLEREAQMVSGLADLARGRNGLKLQLSNYVLAARLKQVIAAANQRLGPMSNNRYRLVYEEPEGGQGQKGLGIRVFDAHTSDERGIETLSGGETFYASLSLALGLAAVIQMEAGGRKIETLFIDEGFGTLDSGTLDQVMNEIETLRSNGRTVGLVSHVEELRSRIPAQIQVTPSKDGSTIEIVGI